MSPDGPSMAGEEGASSPEPALNLLGGAERLVAGYSVTLSLREALDGYSSSGSWCVI